MGYSDDASPEGGPVFNNTPQTTADFERLRKYVEERGQGRKGTSSDRASLTGTDKLFPGLEFAEQDTKIRLVYWGGGWSVLSQPWTDFAPTYTGITFGSGGGSQYAKYKIDNGEVTVRAFAKLGTSGFSVTDPVLVPPVAPAPWLTSFDAIGEGTFIDVSTNTRYAGVLYYNGTNLRLTSLKRDSGNDFLQMQQGAPSQPFTWARDDEIHIFAKYPI